MKTSSTLTYVLFSLLLSSFLTLSAQTVDLNASQLVWTGSKVVGAHTGEVSLLVGRLTVENNQIKSGQFVIDMTSITCTDLTSPDMNSKLVNHLRSEDFFEVAAFPVSELRITESSPFDDNNEAKVRGDLTIKGITLPVEFEVKKAAHVYTTKISVDRTLYGIQYGSGKFFEGLGDRMIQDLFTLDVKITTK